MDGKRAPQRSRQLTPGRLKRKRLAGVRAGRGTRSSSSKTSHRNGSGRNTFDERIRELIGRMPLMGRVTGYGRRQRPDDRVWDNASLAGS